MTEPRAYTAEEAREMFLQQAHSIATCWAKLENQSPMDKCHGVVFSLLVMLDGGSGDMPAYDLSVSPHPSDKEYHQEHGENWYEPGMVINDCQLHEEYVRIKKPLEPKKCKTCAKHPTPGWVPDTTTNDGWVLCPTCQG